MAIKNTSFGGSDWTDGSVLTHTDLNDTFNATEDWLDDNVGVAGTNGDLCFPIGSVVALNKSLTGVPATSDSWVECNGQPISDSDSPFDGENAPDLNGDNRFLYGSTTSGSEAGSATHRHYYNDDGGWGDTYGNTGPNYPNPGTYSTYASSEPPYFNVVWIMRIK